MTNARHTSTIANTVFDEANNAIRTTTTVAKDTVDAVTAAGTVAIDDTVGGVAIGDQSAPDRDVGILVINVGDETVYLGLDAAPVSPWTNDITLLSKASVELPTNDIIKGICASGLTSTISYAEA